MALVVDPDMATEQEALLELNVHESFRWQDQATAGFARSVFDTTPTTFEPVTAFGANSSTRAITPKP